MRGLALIACALVLATSPARADVVVLGAPPAVDAGSPDAGLPLDVPVELQAGQPAPFHGYELSDARATQLVINQNAQQATAEAKDTGVVVAAIILGATFLAGALVGGYVVAKVK